MSSATGEVGGHGGSQAMSKSPAPPSDSRQTNLSRSQLMIWTGQALAPETPLYNMAFRFDLPGEVDYYLFRAAFQALIDQCDALRTVFFEINSVPFQRVLPELIYQLELIDLYREPDATGAADRWIRERCKHCLDLGKRSFDSALIRVAPSRWIWYLNQHHLTMDAWSTTVLCRTLARLYGKLKSRSLDGGKALPAFADYLAYERSLRSTDAFASAATYWEGLAANPPPRMQLYGCTRDPRRPATERVPCPLGRERSERLRTLAQTPGIRTLSVHMTIFNLLASALFAYLSRVSGSQTPVIGTPSHNRSSLAFRETVGLFIELFPLKVDLAREETFRTLLDKVGAQSQDYLRHALPGASSASGMRLFGVVLNYIHASFEPFDGIPMQPEWIHTGFGDPEHDLRLQVHDFEGSGDLIAYFDFNCDLFPRALRRRAILHFLAMLDACIEDPDRRIDHVALTDAVESARLLVDFNETGQTSLPSESIVEMFRQQAVRTPGATALAQGDRNVSYRELDEKSEVLARLIASREAGAGTLVGIFVERSIEMVLGILAVLKAGAGYVPLESRLPEKRLAFILQDTGVRLVLTREELASRLPDTGVEVLDLETALDPDEASDTPLEPAVPGQTAYVIYTSGSTGKPKGVIVDHSGLSGYAVWARKTFAPQPCPSFPLYSSFGFDLTVTSIFVPLICGGSVVIYPEEGDRGDLAILRVFEEDRVDVVKLTPAHLQLVQERELVPSRIRTLILGGENLKSSLAHRVVEASGGRMAVFNEYGPTEAVVGCMVHRFDPDWDRGSSVPVGVPANGVRIYVLDAGGNPVPEGVAGEMYVGGPRLARGYLNRNALTDERFLCDPFVPGGRMYRTGDLARFNPSGLLEYIGRNDDQVKVRGVRIEPAEIEQAVLEHPQVSACALRVTGIVRRETSRDAAGDLRYCVKCGLASNYPGAEIDDAGICNICRDYDGYRTRAGAYFGTMDQLCALFGRAQTRGRGRYDCLMLLSGGKDSTYALYRVAEIARNVLAVTLDNGYVSDGAKANIARVVSELGVDHRYLRTPAMNAIFVDSLERHSNVCQGCFKTLYTLAAETALDEDIPLVVTGLSRGQFFETRLTPELFRNSELDVASIDQTVLEARKAYHRLDDAVSHLLNVGIFRNDRVFEQLQFVDFYRYCDVSLDEMYAFLAEHAPWIRPGDTGRSTNCLINDVGIHIHKRKEGFHNYALPYSWDVRLGHKERDAALAELDDRIDVERVQKILAEIGYEEDAPELGDRRLTVYYTATGKPQVSELRGFLSRRLPEAMIPSSFVQMETIPLTPNGKIDREALPDPLPGRSPAAQVYRVPRTEVEAQLASLWQDVLGVQRVGIEDNFFDLGGDSIAAIQVVARANDAGLLLTPHQLFQHQTVAELATVAETRTVADQNASDTETQVREQSDPASDYPMIDLDEQKLGKLAALLNKS